MTNEEMIKRLSAFITCLKCETSGKECDLNCATQYEAGTMGEIIEMFETIVEKLEDDRWVPCSEWLPEEDGEYLCCYGKRIHKGQMINGHFRHYGEIADHLITAWKPMPEPYKEGKQ